MKTLISSLFILALFVSSCDLENITGNKFQDLDQFNRDNEIRLITDGHRYYSGSKVYTIPSNANFITIKFKGDSDSDTTSYISTLSISLNDSTVKAIIGSSYISGQHSFTFSTGNMDSLTLSAQLFCDDFGYEGNCDVGAYLFITDIEIQYSIYNPTVKDNDL